MRADSHWQRAGGPKKTCKTSNKSLRRSEEMSRERDRGVSMNQSIFMNSPSPSSKAVRAAKVRVKRMLEQKVVDVLTIH